MSDNKIMICPGLINGTDYKNEIDERFSGSITSIILYDRLLDNPNSNSTWDDLTFNSKVYYLRDNLNDKNFDNVLFMHAVKIHKKIYFNGETFLISDRTFKYNILKRNADYLVDILKIILTCVSIIKSENPTHILFVLRPHNLYFWIMKIVAEYFNVKVLILEISVLPKGVLILEGSEEKLFNLGENFEKKGDLSAHDVISDFAKLEGSEKQKIENKKLTKTGVIKRIFSRIKKLPKLRFKTIVSILFSEIRASKLKKYLSDIALEDISCLGEKKIVTIFLHYQPESTTLPLGRDYNNQLAAILSILSGLPEGWVLLVKEHPSTFGQEFSLTNNYRNFAFYEFIRFLPNCHMIPISASLQEVLDYSDCVATIAGTVGMQAISVGKKVITFSNVNYGESDLVLNISNSITPDEDIKSFLEMAKKEDKEKNALVDKLIRLTFFDPFLDYGIQQNPKCSDVYKTGWVLALQASIMTITGKYK